MDDMQQTRAAAGRFLYKYWYYAGIVAMFMVGWMLPSTGLWMKSAGITPWLVAMAFFLNGFALSTQSLVENMREWKLLLVALLITFVVSPALLYALRSLIPGGDSTIGEGFQLVSIVPTLFVSAVVLTRIAKGNASTALCLTVSSNLLAIFVAPLLIKLTLKTGGAALDLRSTITGMLITVLLPTVAGQLARSKWEQWATSHARLITVVSQSVILVFVITGVSTLPRSILTPSILAVTLTEGTALHLILLSIGKVGACAIGVRERESRAMTFCTAQKSFAFNILLCEHLFSGNSTSFGMAIFPGIVYYLIVLTVDSVIAERWSRIEPIDDVEEHTTKRLLKPDPA